MGPEPTFVPSGFFVVRTPLLPFQELVAWAEGLEAPAALGDPARLEPAFARDRTRLRERLSAIVSRPEVREAILLAAPELDTFLDSWRREPETKRGRNTQRTLVRYFSRMAGRATPFGLFAGISVGTLGSETCLVVEGRAKYRRHTRLDMDYLFTLVDALGRDPSLRHVFSYRPNSSLYRAAGRVRYVESRLAGRDRSYHLVAVDDTADLDTTLTRARAGAGLATLAEALVDCHVSFAETTGYIERLIENQILVPEIALPVTGPEPIHPLVDQLRERAETTDAADLLSQARAALRAIDAAGLGVEPERYRAVARLLERLPAKVELSRLFQVDLVKPAPGATLGETVIGEIVRGVEILHRVAGGRPREDALARFRDAFLARYEDREIPLVEALDEEVGVGFGAGADAEPLLEGLALPSADEDVGTDGVRHALLLRKLSEALARGAHEITLDPRDVDAMASKDPVPLPDAFAVTATLVAPSHAALAQGDFRLILGGAAGPSGACLFGRFCHADDTLRAHVERHLRAEEAHRPDAVFAEIVHLPEGRIGNVLLRPNLRDWEIPYLGRSGVAPDRQIPVTDLRVSVRNGRIRLRSASLDREVIPRMANAHNYNWSLGPYRFLCALQVQGSTVGLGWKWNALSSAPFLPRVAAGRLILCPARWRASKEELRLLGAREGAARFRAVQTWRAERALPRLVALADGDNVLPVDLDNALSVESFVHLVKGRDEATLVEMLPVPDQLCAHGPEGRFVHELIVPFVKKPDVARRAPAEVSAPSQQRLARRFAPGSEWLYAKLYTGTATADHVLRDVVRPVVDEALASGAGDSWFFVRYGDPDWHLRLRIHGEPAGLLTGVVPAMHAAAAPLLDDGRLWRVQLDTYEREVERYGGADGIVLAEQVFRVDSEAVLEIIEMLEPGDAGGNERWRLALRGIDSLLTDLGCDLDDKRALSKRLREAFAREFRADASLRGQLGDKYRTQRTGVERLFDPVLDDESPLAPGYAVLRRRSAQLAPVVAELRRCEWSGRLTVPVVELASSYVHMHVNRLLRAAHRAQELVLYDLLARVYASHAARTRGGLDSGERQDDRVDHA